MSFARAMKRRAKAAVWPCAFLLIAGYFLWNATQGDRGLAAYAQRQTDLVNAQAELARAEADRVAWDRRVSGLRTNRLDTDALDERARAMLNLSDERDIVVPYGNGKKLY